MATLLVSIAESMGKMQVAHLLRKYNPREWGGTETAVKRLFDGLKHHRVNTVVFCPRLDQPVPEDPLRDAGYTVKRFKACVPVWGIPPAQREQLVSVGGNLMSFSLIKDLWREPDLSLIHTHTQNRLGGIALTISRLRKIPCVVTVHGGVLDLPAAAREYLAKPLKGGMEWGKIFGAPLRSRKVLQDSDAIITCNKKEAELLQKKYPNQRVVVQPHGVPAGAYQQDQRQKARVAFPQLAGKKILLMVGRIDAVKNQRWVIEQFPALLARHPNLHLVLAGSVTDAAYGQALVQDVKKLGIENQVLLTGGLGPGDPLLLGVFQIADIVLLPSISETFGLVLLEAWAAGRPVVSSRTSGARELVVEGENGRLFDLEKPESFHMAIDSLLNHPEQASRMAAAGTQLVKDKYDTVALGGRIRDLYQELIAEKRK